MRALRQDVTLIENHAVGGEASSAAFGARPETDAPAAAYFDALLAVRTDNAHDFTVQVGGFLDEEQQPPECLQ